MIQTSHHIESIKFRFTPCEKIVQGYVSNKSERKVAFQFKRTRLLMRSAELVYGDSKIQYRSGSGEAKIGGNTFDFSISRRFPVFGGWILRFSIGDSNFSVSGRFLNKDTESGNWLIQRNLDIDGLKYPYAFSVDVGQDLPLVGKVEIKDSSNDLDKDWSGVLFPLILWSSLVSDIIPLRVN